VLALVRQRLTNAEIAAQLVVSVRTVETHVSALLRKLDAADRRALIGSGGSVPPASSVNSATLPATLTPFVGRSAERADLVEALRSHRLVTATGAGGIGKTRLAIAAAQDVVADHDDGVVFVDLVKVTDPAMVNAAAAAAAGVLEAPGQDRGDTLVAALVDRDVLIVMDNCEHVQDAARVCIERVLRTCPGVCVLATSRLRLMLPFEHVVSVPGLSLDRDGGGEGDAVTLFVGRMLAAGGPPPAGPADWDRIRFICASLDGMALGIELAAARVPGLGLEALANALDSRLQILAVGSRAEDRHRSLRAAIDWTYGLLAPDEQVVLRAAAVFAAPFTWEAVAELVGGRDVVVIDALGRLVDWNLISLTTASGGRYRMMETVRQYAAELAASAGEDATLHEAHLDWCRARFRALLADAPGDDDWCVAVDGVLDEGRAVLARAREHGDVAAPVIELTGLLADVLFQRGHPAEAQRRDEDAAAVTHQAPAERRAWLRRAAGAAAARNVGADCVELLGQAADIALAAEAADDAAYDLACAAALQFRATGILRRPPDTDEVDRLLERARATSRGAAHAEAAIAVAAGWAPRARARSRQLTAEAQQLASAAADSLLVVEALDQLTALELSAGDIGAAAAAIDRRLAILADVPFDARSGFEHYDARHMACHVFLAAGRLAEARRYADAVAALPYFREQRHIGLARRLEVDAMAGDFHLVVEQAQLFEQDWRRAGRPVAGNLAIGPYAAAFAFGVLGDAVGRAHWIEITRALVPSADWLDVPDNVPRIALDGLLLLDQGDPDGAHEVLALDPERAAGLGVNGPLWAPWYAAAWAEARVLAACPGADDDLDRAARAARGNVIALTIIARADALRAGDDDELPALAARFAAAGCPYQERRTRHLAEHRAGRALS
jgi:predicted ATPase